MQRSVALGLLLMQVGHCVPATKRFRLCLLAMANQGDTRLRKNALIPKQKLTKLTQLTHSSDSVYTEHMVYAVGQDLADAPDLTSR